MKWVRNRHTTTMFLSVFSLVTSWITLLMDLARLYPLDDWKSPVI